MHNQIDGYAVAYGVIAIAAGVLIWMPKWHIRLLHPVSMVAFLVGGIYLTIGVHPWLDALARLTSSGPGIVGMLIVAGFGAAVFLYEIFHGHKDDGKAGSKGSRKGDRARAFALAGAGVFGVAVILVVANAGRLLREATHSPARTGHALAQTVRGITSGRAAHAQTLHQAVIIVALVIAGIIVAAVLMRKHERQHAAPAQRKQLAITSGRPAGIAAARGNSTTASQVVPAAKGR